MVNGENQFVSDGDLDIWFVPTADLPTQGLSLRKPHLQVDGAVAVAWSESSDHAVRINLRERKLDLVSISDHVSACAISGDSLAIASAYTDGRIKIHDDSETDRDLRSPTAGRVTAIAFALQGEQIVSGSENGDVSITSVTGSFKSSSADSQQGAIVSVQVNDGQRRFATVGADGSIKVWSLDTRSGMFTIADPAASFTECCFAAEGTLLAAVATDHTIRIYDGSTGKELATCRGHRGPIAALSIANDAIYSCSEDRTIRMWDLFTGEQRGLVYGANPFRSISVRMDDAVLAGDNSGGIWNLRRVPAFSQRGVISGSVADSELAERLRLDLKKK